MYKYLLTCPLGLESLAKKQVQKLGYTIDEVQDKAVYFSGGIEALARVNIWSRFGNSLYIILNSQTGVNDFESYFDAVESIAWDKYIPEGFLIQVEAASIKSGLSSTPTLQSLAKKAIVSRIGNGDFVREDESRGKIQVQILLKDNTLRIMLNSSGVGLHKRGYREMTGDAPMKENLAAALVMLSGWKYKEPLYDIFCGSGTIAIEAAMIARNIAPGKNRHFAFESWAWLPENLLKSEVESAESQEYSGNYNIYATDIRKDIQQLASRNATFAGVADTITFGSQDYKTYLRREIEGTLVSNPPYGLRLEDTNVDQIHSDVSKLFEQNKNLSGGIITAYPDFETLGSIKYKKRKLYNGGEKCYFYKKM